MSLLKSNCRIDLFLVNASGVSRGPSFELQEGIAGYNYTCIGRRGNYFISRADIEGWGTE